MLRLDAESRRNRFGGAVSDEFIRRYSEPSALSDAVIHGFFVDGVLRGAAELRPLGSGGEVEAAFSIEKTWQSHGVGTALLERTLLAARNRQIKLLHMTCLAENQRMQQLALKFDAELTFDFGSVVGEVEAPHPTPMSMMREFVADSTGFATAMCSTGNHGCSSRRKYLALRGRNIDAMSANDGCSMRSLSTVGASRKKTTCKQTHPWQE